MIENPSVRTADEEREPVVWPDPSPLSSWWADVMAHRSASDSNLDCRPDPELTTDRGRHPRRSARSQPPTPQGVG